MTKYRGQRVVYNKSSVLVSLIFRDAKINMKSFHETTCQLIMKLLAYIAPRDQLITAIV